ncbi:uncharacterized protein TM35_000081630 [Trypanosoma theileri]|uniref:SET domain-containing protein n=1 Tax=Trypanosoma theileri TaxID=67003 RepID=A0A1X0P0B9_9TRYP|nr:uncharacterized protein TM35_000081630 [Trypanosoma theileri]ORC90365.1 hypothetical protein TM35_000081630 [Trypanosoma theileri]
MSLCFGTDHSPPAFHAWAKRRGVFLHPDVAFLVPTRTMGLGVFARTQLPAGTVVVGCPLASSISPYARPESSEAPCIKALEEAHITDNVLHVVLRLMAEAVRPKSPWMSWMKACPRMPDHFFYEAVTARENTEAAKVFGLTSDVAGTSTTTTTGVSMRWTGISQQLRDMKLAERWEAAQKIIRQYPEYWPEEHATLALFCECLAQVFSRNFHREQIEGREGPYLLPGLDIINHSTTGNAKFEIRGGGRKHAMNFCVITTRDLRRGEQVFCSYGRIGASRFAIEFQFVTDSILKEDMLRFSVDVIAEMTSILTMEKNSSTSSSSLVMNSNTIQRRVEWLQRLGLLYDEGFYISRLNLSKDDDKSNGDNDDSNGILPETTMKEIQTLFNVFYLMTVESAKFEKLVHTINRDWQVERTNQVVELILRVLSMRAEAVLLQLEAAETYLTQDSDQVRRKLLQRTLKSELEMIQLLEQHVKNGNQQIC